MSNLFVVCMGIGTVFIALIVLVVLCTLMSKIVMATERRSMKEEVKNKTSEKTDTNEIENRGMIVAAISAAVAEELGTDISAIKIVSLKRV